MQGLLAGIPYEIEQLRAYQILNNDPDLFEHDFGIVFAISSP
jgi:hypothetical protein